MKSYKKLYETAKPFIIALWLSLLFLPFKGIFAALIFFIVISVLLVSSKYPSEIQKHHCRGENVCRVPVEGSGIVLRPIFGCSPLSS